MDPSWDQVPYTYWVVDRQRRCTKEHKVVVDHSPDCTVEHLPSRYWLLSRGFDETDTYRRAIGSYVEIPLQSFAAHPGALDILLTLLDGVVGIVCLACDVEAPFTDIDRIDSGLFSSTPHALARVTGPFPLSIDQFEKLANEEPENLIDLTVETLDGVDPPSWVPEVLYDADTDNE